MPTKPSLEFNARFMPAAKVAATFVAPDQFADVVALNHNIIIGPRGSGKTTLLKMLTVPALQHWSVPSAPEVVSRIEFNGALIASDHVWSEQLESASEMRHTEDGGGEWGKVAFFIHTILGLLSAIQSAVRLGRGDPPPYMKHLAVNFSPEEEAEFVRFVASGLKIDVPATTMLGLEVALRGYLNLMDPRCGRIKRVAELPLARAGDFFNSLTLIVSVVNELSNAPERRWGLLFDEIEIAPDPIRKLLFSSLKSFDQRFVIKIALWPYMQELEKHSAIFGESTVARGKKAHSEHDYYPVNLAYSHKDHSDDFSFRFVEHLFAEMGVKRAEFP